MSLEGLKSSGRPVGTNSTHFCPNPFFCSPFSLFLAVPSVPGGSKKLREACRKNVHLVSSKSEAVGPSYDQTTDKINEYKVKENGHHLLTVYVSFVICCC